MVVETALALVLLIGSGLLVKSFVRLQQVNPGFRPDHVLAMHVSLPAFKYKEAGQIDAFYRQALESIRRLPGVQAAGATSILPMSGQNSSGSFSIEGRAMQPGEVAPHGDRWSVTEGYFQAMPRQSRGQLRGAAGTRRPAHHRSLRRCQLLGGQYLRLS